MKDKQHILLLVMVLLFTATLIYGMNRFKGENFGLFETSTYEMSTDWFFEDIEGYEMPVTLPVSLTVPSDTEYSYSTYIPEDFPEGMSILFRTSQQSVRVLVDGHIIYERGQDPSKYPGTFRGSSWNTVLISQKDAGKKLTLTLMSPYQNFSGTLGEVRYGYKSALLYYIIKQQMVQLVCATIMMFIGIILFLFHVVKVRGGSSSVHIIYLALFAVFCSLYLFGESRMLQFFISNEFLITALPFLSETLFPIPLFMYIKTRWLPRHQWIAVMFQWVFAINFLIILALQFMDIADFYETMIIFHVSAVAAMVTIILVSGLEIFKYKNRDSLILAQALGILILGSAAGILQIYQQSFARVGISLQIGILGFEIVMVVDAIQSINRVEEQLREKSYFEKLAYIDALTGGMNRNAYTNRIFELSTGGKHKAILYALFDVNDLKIINDTYGHPAGDDAIRRIYGCLIKAFGQLGDCYRIGGDEFAIIMENCTEEDYEVEKRRLDHELELNNREVDYHLSIAGGHAVAAVDEELSFESLMKQADQMLYQNKHHYKLKHKWNSWE